MQGEKLKKGHCAKRGEDLGQSEPFQTKGRVKVRVGHRGLQEFGESGASAGRGDKTLGRERPSWVGIGRTVNGGGENLVQSAQGSTRGVLEMSFRVRGGVGAEASRTENTRPRSREQQGDKEPKFFATIKMQGHGGPMVARGSRRTKTVVSTARAKNGQGGA